MGKVNIKVGDKVIFQEDKLPYDIKAINERFAICTRKLDKKEDNDLLKHQVDMDVYFSMDSAFEDLKDEVIYTIIDFDQNKRGPNDLVFNPYDYRVQRDIDECMVDLLSGNCKLSKRNEIELTHIKIYIFN